MKKLLLSLVLLATTLVGQISPPDRIRLVTTAPTVGTSCITSQAMQRDISAGATSGHVFSCEAGLWADISSASGSGSPFTDAGTFNNTVMTLPLQGLINSASPLADYQKGQSVSNYSAIGVAGSVIVPSTSTNHEADGIFGSCTGNNATTNCVGGAFYAFAATDGTNGSADANRNRLWGFNTLLGDKAKAHIYMTNEMDFNVTGTDTKVIAWQVTGASTQQLTSDSVAIALGPIGTGVGWPAGFYCAQASITSTGQCVKIDPTSSSNNVSSQVLEFLSRSSGGTLNTVDVTAGPGGGLNFTQSAGAGYTFKNSGSTTILVINGGGSVTQTGLALAGLAPTTNGTYVYCTDCLANSNPCTASSTGAFAKRLNGAWDCR